MVISMEAKRTSYLTICFSPAELAALEQRAKSEGLRKSAWARRAVVMALKEASQAEATDA